jgi:hypothetical protein
MLDFDPEDLAMLRAVSQRGGFLLALAFAAFAAGALSASLMPREARAESASSTIQVPPEGLTFRSRDGRAIARLSYDARGGIFEVLGDHGDTVASMGHRENAALPRTAGPKTSWSLDDVRDPWDREPAAPTDRPPSGL